MEHNLLSLKLVSRFQKTIQESSSVLNSLHGKETPFHDIISNLDVAISKIQDVVSRLRADLERKVDELNDRVERNCPVKQVNLPNQCKTLTFSGIPRELNEDLPSIFSSICKHLNYPEQKLPHVVLRRVGKPSSHPINSPTYPSNSNPFSSSSMYSKNIISNCKPTLSTSTTPSEKSNTKLNRTCYTSTPTIFVEFTFKSERDEFFRKYLRCKDLNLTCLGVNYQTRIYINDCLNKTNFRIKIAAIGLKRDGLLYSVSTFNGLVYVQKSKGSPKQLIVNHDDLTVLCLKRTSFQ